jgi:amino acid permease
MPERISLLSFVVSLLSFFIDEVCANAVNEKNNPTKTIPAVLIV